MSASYRTPVSMSKLSKKSLLLLQRLKVQPDLTDSVYSKANQVPSASTSEDSVQPVTGGLEAERMARVRSFIHNLLGQHAAPDVLPSLDDSPPSQV